MRYFLCCVLLLAAGALADTGQLEQTLLHGDSAARLGAIQQFFSYHPPAMSDDMLLKSLAACANDPSPQVRSKVALLIGSKWIQTEGISTGLPIDIEVKLAHDPDARVRHDVVTAGLRFVKQKNDRVITALVQLGMTLPVYSGNIESFVMDGLKQVPAGKIAALLEPYWKNAKADPDHAAWAYLIYLGATRQQPPGVDRLNDAGHFLIAAIGARGSVTPADIAEELEARVPPGTIRQTLLSPPQGQAYAWLVIDGVGNRRRVVAALAQDPVIALDDDPSRWLFNIADTETLAWIKKQIATSHPSVSPNTYAAAFQQLYAHLGNIYPDFQMKGIDWKKIGAEFLPRIKEVKTERDFGLLVEELVAQLKDSHAVVEPGSAQPPMPDLPMWDPGFACLTDDRGKPVVYVVEKDSPAEAAGVRPGMTVISVNSTPAEQAIARTMQSFSEYFGYSSDRTLRYDAVRSFMCQQRRGAVVDLKMERVDGTPEEVALRADYGERYLPRLPVPRAGIDDSANVSWTRLNDRIGYIYVRRIQNGLEASLDAALTGMKGIRGLIIDVRGNSGGGFDPEAACRNFDLSPSDTAQPDRPRYRGPIALLIDGRTISAAEGWTSWFVANKRARLFGTATAGASSGKEIYTLSNGMYRVVVPAKAYTGFLDRPIEVRGLEPDVPVKCNARDLAAQKDTVVDAATQWLVAQLK